MRKNKNVKCEIKIKNGETEKLEILIMRLIIKIYTLYREVEISIYFLPEIAILLGERIRSLVHPSAGEVPPQKV